MSFGTSKFKAFAKIVKPTSPQIRPAYGFNNPIKLGPAGLGRLPIAFLSGVVDIRR
jgi:hypothetical protein